MYLKVYQVWGTKRLTYIYTERVLNREEKNDGLVEEKVRMGDTEHNWESRRLGGKGARGGTCCWWRGSGGRQR